MKKLVHLAALSLILALPLLAITTDARASGGWLGVYTQSVDPDLKEAFQLKSDYGVIINHVVSESPAEKAGLKQGDIIISLDGTKLTGSDQLSEMIRKYQKADQVEVQVNRKGKEMALSVTVGSRDDSEGEIPDAPAWIGKVKTPKGSAKIYSYLSDKSLMSNSYIGINLESLNAQLGEYFGVKDGDGALVTEVFEDSPAQKAGFKAGDVIVSIDGTPVTSPLDVQKAIREKEKGEKANIGFLREKKNMEMAVEIEERSDYSFEMPDIVIPDVPGLDNFDFHFVPKMKGLYQGDFDEDIPDMEGIQESMKHLKEQMKELQKQLEEMKLRSGEKD